MDMTLLVTVILVVEYIAVCILIGIRLFDLYQDKKWKRMMKQMNDDLQKARKNYHA